MFLGIDASTQSISAVIIDPDLGNVIADESVNFGAELPQYNAPSGFISGGANGEVHTDPMMWLDALEMLLTRLQGNSQVDLAKIKAISGAGQQHASVYFSSTFEKALTELDPKRSLSEQISPTLSRKTAPIWMDSSTGEECLEIADNVGSDAKVCQISGSIMIPRFTGSQIRKFSKESPQDYAATACIHLNSSFLASIIAGNQAPIDTGDGAGMNLMNLSKSDWDQTLLDATADDLLDKLPPIKPAGTFISNISPYFVEKYGFSADCQALSWTGDNPASLVGMGAAEPGQLVISLGTSDTLFAAMDSPLTDPNGYGHVFGNPLTAGNCMSLICFANGSLARERVKDENNLSWDDFDTKELANTPLGNGGKLAAPFFTPETTPKLDSNQLHTNGWDFSSASDGEKVRATLEGQFLNIRLQSQWMGLNPSQILITGGASQNDGIAQTIANIFNTPVRRLTSTSSVGTGAAIIAAVANDHSYDNLTEAFCVFSSTITTPEAGAGIYDAIIPEYKEFIETLVGSNPVE